MLVSGLKRLLLFSLFILQYQAIAETQDSTLGLSAIPRVDPELDAQYTEGYEFTREENEAHVQLRMHQDTESELNSIVPSVHSKRSFWGWKTCLSGIIRYR